MFQKLPNNNPNSRYQPSILKMSGPSTKPLGRPPPAKGRIKIQGSVPITEPSLAEAAGISNEVEKLKSDLLDTQTGYEALWEQIDLFGEKLANPSTTQKTMLEGGLKILFQSIKHQHKVNNALLTNQMSLFNRMDDIETRMETNFAKVNATAAKQAVWEPVTYASVTATAEDGTAGASSRPAEVRTQLRVVNVNKLQKKQDKESERCSREVVMDVKKLAGLTETIETLEPDEIVDAINDKLREIDPKIDIDKDVFAADLIEGHPEKPYLIKFHKKDAAKRLLDAARASKVEFKQLRPSRTRAERDRYRKEKEAKDKSDGEKKDKKKPTRLYLGKKPESNNGNAQESPSPSDEDFFDAAPDAMGIGTEEATT